MGTVRDEQFESYLRATRRILTLDIPDEQLALVDSFMEHMELALKQSHELDFSATPSFAATMEKRSELVQIGNEQYLFVDQYLTFFFGFFNRLFQLPASPATLRSVFAHIASHEALRQGHLGVSQLLLFEGQTGSPVQTYLEQVPYNGVVAVIQTLLIIAHEFIHLGIARGSAIARDFEAFAAFYLSGPPTEEFIAAEFSAANASTVAVCRKALERLDLLEEMFCDFRALNQVHLFLDFYNTRVRRINSFEQFVIASLSHLVFVKTVAAIEIATRRCSG